MKVSKILKKIRWRIVCIAALILMSCGATWAGYWWHDRYATTDDMLLPIREYGASEYPEDPGERSVHICQYSGRRLRLIRRDATHFDFEALCFATKSATQMFANRVELACGQLPSNGVATLATPQNMPAQISPQLRSTL